MTPLERAALTGRVSGDIVEMLDGRLVELDRAIYEASHRPAYQRCVDFITYLVARWGDPDDAHAHRDQRNTWHWRNSDTLPANNPRYMWAGPVLQEASMYRHDMLCRLVDARRLGGFVDGTPVDSGPPPTILVWKEWVLWNLQRRRRTRRGFEAAVLLRSAGLEEERRGDA